MPATATVAALLEKFLNRLRWLVICDWVAKRQPAQNAQYCLAMSDPPADRRASEKMRIPKAFSSALGLLPALLPAKLLELARMRTLAHLCIHELEHCRLV